jgi:Ca-activated chloride channel family protein
VLALYLNLRRAAGNRLCGPSRACASAARCSLALCLLLLMTALPGAGQTVEGAGGGVAVEQSEPAESGVVFRAEAKEVVLHATVVDKHHRPVPSLKRSAFQVFEDGKRQEIATFRQEDVPVSLAIVIDNSGSMREKRAKVNAAALSLIRASNPQDEVCVVNFNDRAFLDQDFTDDVPALKKAMEHIESRGGTALYDALVASGAHLEKKAKRSKKVILVITDGEDTASSVSLEQAVQSIAVEGGPTVYGIGVLGGRKEKAARHALRILAEQTGGVAFFPSDVGQVEELAKQIAHDIRNQYIISYVPSTPRVAGEYRRVEVKASDRRYGKLEVRTRSGYYIPGEEQKAPHE